MRSARSRCGWQGFDHRPLRGAFILRHGHDRDCLGISLNDLDLEQRDASSAWPVRSDARLVLVGVVR